MRQYKILEQRLTGLTKIKGPRDEPGQCLVDRLTNSNNKQVIFYIMRKADNFYVAEDVSLFYNLSFLRENKLLMNQINFRKI